MKPFLFIIALCCIGGIIFGYMGSYTAWGRKNYDEMAGMIPEFSLIISSGLLAIVVLAYLYLTFFGKK